MLNIIWVLLIAYILFLGVKLNKHIKYKNYNLKLLFLSLIKCRGGLFLTLGTKVGVGSIISTAAAIHIGGIGSVLWIIIFTFLTSSIIYYESLLGSRYKKKVADAYVGGPYFYIKYGLNNNKLAILSTILLICCYSFFFQMIQTNTVASLISLNTNINIHVVSFAFLSLLLFTMFFSIKELLNLLNKIVPFMCLFLLVTSIYILFKNSDILPSIISAMIKDAFSVRGILVGALIGVKRSVFLNELLIGTTSIASSVDECDHEIAACTQVFGSYFITFVICTLISFLILIFIYYNDYIFTSYNELVNQVFLYHYGGIGGLILIVLVTFLAVTTIISGVYIGLSNLSFVSRDKRMILFFKVFVVLFTISGIYLSSSKIWESIDLVILLLIIINIISIRKLIRREVNDRK